MIDRMTNGPTELLLIGEVARRARVRKDTLRYYERLGLVEPKTRSPAGYRLFAPEVVDRLSFIKKAQAMGLTLDEIAGVINSALAGSAPCDHVRATIRIRLADVDERIANLSALRETLVGALQRPRSLRVEDGCLCGIIELQELTADPVAVSGTLATRG